MLILAGVSLNAIIGDNGIITNAQNANFQSQKAILQEFFDQFYIEHYEELGNVDNKAAILQSMNISKNWTYKGKFGYVVDDSGYVHYFLIIENMPKEIRESINYGLGTKSYSDYVNCIDVWGISENLKVYYCENGINTMDGVNLADLGKENGSDIAFAAGSNYAKLLSGNGTTNITKAELRGQPYLTIDSSSGITDLNELYNFTGLSTLTLSNLTLTNLDGIEYATNLKRIFFINCTVGNYSKLKEIRTQFEHIYLQGTSITNAEVEKFCSNTIGIGGADFPNLAYFGIYGQKHFTDDFSYVGRGGFMSRANGVIHSSFSNVNLLSSLSLNTKTRIVNLFLNNNSISDLNNLYEFTNVKNLRIEGNYIKKLDGLYNTTTNTGMTLLTHLFAYNNLLGQGLEGESDGETSGTLNIASDALSSLSIATYNASDGIYSFAERFAALIAIDIGQNYIKNLNYLSCYTALTLLKIDKNSDINLSSGFQSIMTIAEKSGIDFNCDKYIKDYLEENSKKLDNISLANKTMTVTEFNSYMDGRESYVKGINLNGLVLKNDSGVILTNLTTLTFDSAIENVLNSFTKVQAISLKGLENLTNINFVQYMGSNLKQIDLRGTKVTDFSKLVTYSSQINCVLVDYSGITVVNEPDENGNRPITDVEKLINRMAFMCSHPAGGTYAEATTGESYNAGFLLCNTDLLRQLGNTKNVTNLQLDYHTMGWLDENERRITINFDISNSSIEKIYMRNQIKADWVINFPTCFKGLTLNYASNKGGDITVDPDCDVSKLTNFTSLSGSWGRAWYSAVELLKILPNIQSFGWYSTSLKNSFSLAGLTTLAPTPSAISSLESLRLECYSGGSQVGYDNTSASYISNFTNLKTLCITYAYNLTDFSFLTDLTSMEELTLKCTGLASLGFIDVMPNLKKVDFSGCVSLGADGYGMDGEPINNLDKITEAYALLLRRVDISSCGFSKSYVEGHEVASLTWTSFVY